MYPLTHTQTADLEDYNKLGNRLSLVKIVANCKVFETI